MYRFHFLSNALVHDIHDIHDVIFYTETLITKADFRHQYVGFKAKQVANDRCFSGGSV